MANRGYIPGDPWVICDRTGFKVRMSQTKKEWNGLRVWERVWEPRHPQDLIKTRPDRQVVREARPEQADRFVTDNQVKADDL